MATQEQLLAMQQQMSQQITDQLQQKFQQHMLDQHQQIEDLRARLQAAEAESKNNINRNTQATHHSKLTPTKPDTFNGQRKTPADVWLASIEQYFLASQCACCPKLSDEFKINFTAAQLREAAATWWRKEQQQYTTSLSVSPTWSQFKEAFLKHFLPVATKDGARAALHRIKQRNNVAGYCDEFNRQLIILDTNDMSEADQLFLFKQGLRTDLAHDLFLLNPKTLPEAQAAAVRIEIEKPQQKKHNHNWNNNTYHRQHQHAQQGATPMELGSVQTETDEGTDETFSDTESNDEEQHLNVMRKQGNRLNPEQVEEYKRTGKCFKCGKYGHLS